MFGLSSPPLVYSSPSPLCLFRWCRWVGVVQVLWGARLRMREPFPRTSRGALHQARRDRGAPAARGGVLLGCFSSFWGFFRWELAPARDDLRLFPVFHPAFTPRPRLSSLVRLVFLYNAPLWPCVLLPCCLRCWMGGGRRWILPCSVFAQPRCPCQHVVAPYPIPVPR